MRRACRACSPSAAPASPPANCSPNSSIRSPPSSPAHPTAELATEAWYTPACRLRVGNYRLVYEVDDGKVIILVVSAGHRRDIYDR
ncbi:type II toxin-antitoxin system RelE/ParE family toxin [Nocardia flavorosea]|nr:type II toxin-antitoxin system RelE/ParE family toxin [Nocardia flavorosea]